MKIFYIITLIFYIILFPGAVLYASLDTLKQNIINYSISLNKSINNDRKKIISHNNEKLGDGL